MSILEISLIVSCISVMLATIQAVAACVLFTFAVIDLRKMQRDLAEMQRGNAAIDDWPGKALVNMPHDEKTTGDRFRFGSDGTIYCDERKRIN